MEAASVRCVTVMVKGSLASALCVMAMVDARDAQALESQPVYERRSQPGRPLALDS